MDMDGAGDDEVILANQLDSLPVERHYCLNKMVKQSLERKQKKTHETLLQGLINTLQLILVHCTEKKIILFE
jgi:hypothetical protein